MVTTYVNLVFLAGTFGPAGPSIMPDPALSIGLAMDVEQYGLDALGFPVVADIRGRGDAAASTVPLPGAFGLLALGLGALGRRRKG